MRNFFDKKLNTVLSVVLVLLSILVTVQTVFASSIITAGENNFNGEITTANINPRFVDMDTPDEAISTTAEPTEAPTTKPKAKKKTTETTKATKATETTKATKAPTTQSPTVAWATAIKPQTPADYNAQWNAGYLVAIDNPDTTYSCGQVTLSDNDRDLLERLCMGEFGSGGYIGAALIAQSVKDAMCFDGYTSVQSVIDNCHYTGSTKIAASDECKGAVAYVFDQNRDAVQHRIMYMYNPQLVASAFHESQNYILTYQDVRFFDRWGY